LVVDAAVESIPGISCNVVPSSRGKWSRLKKFMTPAADKKRIGTAVAHVSLSFNIVPSLCCCRSYEVGKAVVGLLELVVLSTCVVPFFFRPDFLPNTTKTQSFVVQGRNKGIRKATGAKARGVGLLSRLLSVSRGFFAATTTDRLEHA
jgi:hypothetical protein